MNEEEITNWFSSHYGTRAEPISCMLALRQGINPDLLSKEFDERMASAKISGDREFEAQKQQREKEYQTFIESIKGKFTKDFKFMFETLSENVQTGRAKIEDTIFLCRCGAKHDIWTRFTTNFSNNSKVKEQILSRITLNNMSPWSLSLSCTCGNRYKIHAELKD